MSTLDRALSPGMEAYAAGDYAKAAELLALELEADGGNPVSWRYLAYSLAGIQRGDDAFAAAQKAVAIAPGDAENHFALGYVESSRSRWDAAIDSFDRTLDISSQHPYAKASLVQALMKRGSIANAMYQATRAEADYQRAMHLDRTNPDPVRALVELHREHNQPVKLEQVVREALVAMPKDPHIQALAVSAGIKQNLQMVDEQRATVARQAVVEHQQAELKQAMTPIKPPVSGQAAVQVPSVAPAQGTVPCPQCRLPVQPFLNICPHCKARMRGDNEKVEVVWQYKAYKVVASIWGIWGLYNLVRGALIFSALAGNPFAVPAAILGMLNGLVLMVIAWGLFTEHEGIQFISKIVGYLNLFFLSVNVVQFIGFSTVSRMFVADAILSVIGFTFVLFHLYLLKFVGGD